MRRAVYQRFFWSEKMTAVIDSVGVMLFVFSAEAAVCYV